jgi:hypothetical protein
VLSGVRHTATTNVSLTKKIAVSHGKKTASAHASSASSINKILNSIAFYERNAGMFKAQLNHHETKLIHRPIEVSRFVKISKQAHFVLPYFCERNIEI